ncbi:MAG: GTP-binding protein [Spirochaetaceae bacterium]|nr:MAG: GTP-binding protein [Spirochaetaceae bacterium]
MNVDYATLDTRLPVTIFTGFLGSGKSTLINRILRENTGTRFGLIVNEFGDVPIESRIIETHDDEIIEFPNGCMCCVVKSDLMRAVRTLSSRREKIDHLLVEASGLSDPVPIAQVFLAHETEYVLNGIFCLVDVGRFIDDCEVYGVATSQVAYADVVFLSKLADTSEGYRRSVERRISDIAPSVPLVALDSRVDLRPYVVPSGLHPLRSPAAAEAHEHSHDEVVSLVFSSSDPIDASRLRDVLDELPEGVIRAKGVLTFADRTRSRYRHVLQIVGIRREIETRKKRRDEPAESVIVFIGRDFDPDDLDERLRRCITVRRGAA